MLFFGTQGPGRRREALGLLPCEHEPGHRAAALEAVRTPGSLKGAGRCAGAVDGPGSSVTGSGALLNVSSGGTAGLSAMMPALVASRRRYGTKDFSMKYPAECPHNGDVKNI